MAKHTFPNSCRSAACLSVQGWGQLVNLGVLMVGLLAFNSKGSGPYSHGAAGATYRFSFGFIAVLVLWMAYYRTWRMKPARGPEAEPLRGDEGAGDAKKGGKVRGCSCCGMSVQSSGWGPMLDPWCICVLWCT